MSLAQRSALIAALCAGLPVQAGPPGQPELNAEQILEKSIAATGGRQAYARLRTTRARGTVEFQDQHLHGTVEFCAKAPNKRLLVFDFEHLGPTRQGFDGKVAWVEDPINGLRKLTGAELERVRLEADFHRPLKWRELYAAIELIGVEQVAGRPAYVLRLTPKRGMPGLHYYDAETFLLVRQDLPQPSARGVLEIRAWFSDYRDAGGVKTPFRIEQEMAGAKVVIHFTEIRNNVPLDDALFAMPSKR
ncbi:MAG: hypothetical protein RMI94_01125 [Bryobacterales bacterium]|nr:hypothetical protein [Bryobacteraceae bacterium]MDW8129123.1 hypothetical protein [Bryobacterales bacterium]